jgi:hypothetical protein
MHEIVHILYDDLEKKEAELQHYKELFAASNTSLLATDESIYHLKKENKNIKIQNSTLQKNYTILQKDFSKLKKDINKLSLSQGSGSGGGGGGTKLVSNNKPPDSIPIGQIENWLQNYVNSKCIYTKMNTHEISYKKKKGLVKNNKYTLGIMLNLFLEHHGTGQFNKLVNIDKKDEKECSICYTNIKESTKLTCNCTQTYCLNCISTWIKSTGKCPVCRKKASLLEQSLSKYLKIFK